MSLYHVCEHQYILLQIFDVGGSVRIQSKLDYLFSVYFDIFICLLQYCLVQYYFAQMVRNLGNYKYQTVQQFQILVLFLCIFFVQNYYSFHDQMVLQAATKLISSLQIIGQLALDNQLTYQQTFTCMLFTYFIICQCIFYKICVYIFIEIKKIQASQSGQPESSQLFNKRFWKYNCFIFLCIISQFQQKLMLEQRFVEGKIYEGFMFFRQGL
eukprot:TRINITY_DN734_c0_g1_i1.p2 TRINITY_DN734_c0_g1~~TRINITY_DN734_c0_g1_i1.p2  ORF type:complete len:212 (-),score=-17.48 TRINITY_DN734_c0_g1_i1:207-842(-)